MASVIDSSNIDSKNIKKYHFKVLSNDLKKNKKSEKQTLSQEDEQEDQTEIESEQVSKPPKKNEPVQNSSESSSKDQSTFVEELLKKTDELSSNIIKMQMQMETQQEEFSKRLQEEKSRAFEDGVEEGGRKAHESFDAELKGLHEKFTNSISKIENLESRFEEKLSVIEQNLSSVAVDIAKEVINIEVESNSAVIAESLAKELSSSIKDATHIEIKVSLEDYEYLKESFKSSKNIEIIADDAIAKGGVILLSDIGNIDGDLDVRLKKVKELLLHNKE